MIPIGIGDAFSIIKYLKEEYDNAKILSALFKWDCTFIEGDKHIKITTTNPRNIQKQWYYKIEAENPYKDYIFLPYPVNPAVNVDYYEDDNRTARIELFRYVPLLRQGFRYGGAAELNLNVDFFVFVMILKIF